MDWRRTGLATGLLLLVVAPAGPSAATTAPSWSLQSTPNPGSTTTALLTGVSCASTARCTAVGYDAALTLAEAWNGTSWVVQHTPNPVGATYAALNSVSCVVPTACTAVGAFTNSGVGGSFAESWNGATWKIQRTVNPSGATPESLQSVSCVVTGSGSPTPEFCAAVGSYTNSVGTQLPLAETWSGTRWIRSQVAVRSAATYNVLGGVSCISATECTAVGSDINSAAGQVTLVEVWNGSEWKIQASANPSIDDAPVLRSVSCTSPTACTAGGYAQKKLVGGIYDALAERWNGTKWSITSPPATTFETAFLGMRCLPANACVAVGLGSSGGGTPVTLAEISNGKGWSVQPTPNPGGGGFTIPELSAISCPTTTVCMAVGRTQNGSTVSTLAELYS
jgi:hypothetical protein